MRFLTKTHDKLSLPGDGPLRPLSPLAQWVLSLIDATSNVAPAPVIAHDHAEHGEDRPQPGRQAKQFGASFLNSLQLQLIVSHRTWESSICIIHYRGNVKVWRSQFPG